MPHFNSNLHCSSLTRKKNEAFLFLLLRTSSRDIHSEYFKLHPGNLPCKSTSHYQSMSYFGLANYQHSNKMILEPGSLFHCFSCNMSVGCLIIRCRRPSLCMSYILVDIGLNICVSKHSPQKEESVPLPTFILLHQFFKTMKLLLFLISLLRG